MRILGRSDGRPGGLIALIFILIAFNGNHVFAGTAAFPGAYQFGDSGQCDGFILGTDVLACKNSVVGLGVDYSIHIISGIYYYQKQN